MHVRAAVRSDIAALAAVFARAFNDDLLFAALHPLRNEFPDDFVASFERSFQMLFCRRNALILLAEDDATGKAAGVAVWIRDGTLGGKDVNPRAGLLLGARPSFSRPPGCTVR